MGPTTPRKSTRAPKGRSAKSPPKSTQKPRDKARPTTPALNGKLQLLALRLEVIHRTALAVEMALRYQNADEDTELADCLRHGVCVPIWDQSQKAHALAKQLGGHRNADALGVVHDRRSGSHERPR